jgi:hypothetical protein
MICWPLAARDSTQPVMRGPEGHGTLGGMPSEVSDLLPIHRHSRPLWLRLLCFVGAIICLVMGVVGWLIPVVTGIPFYAAAVVLLAVASDRTREWVNALERRLPHDTRISLRHWLRRIPFLRRHLLHAEDDA